MNSCSAGGDDLGFALYFFVLKRIDVTRVALIALITPVTALLLGHFLNDEPVNAQTWVGAGLIILGLAFFEYGGSRVAVQVD